MANPNIGVLAATTFDNYRKTLADNIFKDNVTLNHFMENGGVERKDGGKTLRVPLMYGTNSTVLAFDGTDTLDLTYQSGIDAAEYSWKYYNVSSVISKTEELENSGKSQIIDLVKAKVMQAENSLKERVNNDLFNGAGSNAKEITGLETAVGTGTYAGIAGGTYTFWQSYVETTSAILTVDMIRTGMNTVNKGAGGSKCSIMVTTQALHEKYESLLTATLNYDTTSTKEMKRLGDAGFYALGFRGIPVVWDEQATSGAFYFLNTDNAKIAIHKDADFVTINKADPTDQHVSVNHIMVAMQLIVNRRASLGKLINKTTS